MTRQMLVWLTVDDDDTDEVVMHQVRKHVTPQAVHLPKLVVHLIGSPVDGLRLVGPWLNREQAVESGDTVTSDWWVMEVEPADVDDLVPLIAAPGHAPDWED